MFPIPLNTLNDKQRHDYILKNFVFKQNNESNQNRVRRDIDVIKEHHRFLWNDDEQHNAADEWALRLARRYYDKLFKEYCIADLSLYKENKVALRWRTEQEVVTGKGQFICGSRKCDNNEDLRTWEVNFAYNEHGERKNALVKLRLCPEHSIHLNYTSRKREIKRLKRNIKLKNREEKRKQTKHHKSKKKYKTSSNSEISDSDQDITTKSTTTSIAEQNDVSTEESTEATNIDLNNDEDIWNREPEINDITNTRENDFERYLEDLLL